jgi:hypothetical protein
MGAKAREAIGNRFSKRAYIHRLLDRLRSPVPGPDVSQEPPPVAASLFG